MTYDHGCPAHRRAPPANGRVELPLKGLSPQMQRVVREHGYVIDRAPGVYDEEGNIVLIFHLPRCEF